MVYSCLRVGAKGEPAVVPKVSRQRESEVQRQ
jgi:hypothetical protein